MLNGKNLLDGVLVTELFSIGIAILLSAMLPGPDFALVTRNTLSASRKLGIYTSLGIVAGLMVHVTYCMFGLAVLISESRLFFNVLRYAGAAYLVYLGVTTLRLSCQPSCAATRGGIHSNVSSSGGIQPKNITPFKAFRQGFICNVFNPKAALFFLALFTMVITPSTSNWVLLAICFEVMLIPLIWFSSLTVILSHPRVYALLNRAEVYITRLLGILLLGFAALLLMA